MYIYVHIYRNQWMWGLNEKQDNNEYKLIKTFNAEMEQIFQEGLKKRWIEENYHKNYIEKKKGCD